MNEFNQERTVTLAVALSYDEVNAPRVTAKGGGDVAQQILAIARRTASRMSTEDTSANWCNCYRKSNWAIRSPPRCISPWRKSLPLPIT